MGALSVGKYTYGNPTRRGDVNTVRIGAFCSIAENVLLDGGFQHNMKSISTFPFPSKVLGCDHLSGHVVCKGDIEIGNDVWIGEQSVIMSGVKIGDGAVIGLRSIISKDVQPYEVVVGAPQKVLRKRFSDTDILLLLQMKWWDWKDEQIIEAAPLLMSENIPELYNHYLNKIV